MWTHPELSIQASQYIVVLMMVGTLLWAVIRKSLTPILLSIVLVAGGMGQSIDEPAEGDIGSAVIGGQATWYCSETSACTNGYGPSDMVAAIDPTLGIPKGSDLTVCHEGDCIAVTVVDVCACKDARIIDLTSGAFSRLAPLGAGVITVSIEIAGPRMTLPPTDTEEQP